MTVISACAPGRTFGYFAMNLPSTVTLVRSIFRRPPVWHALTGVSGNVHQDPFETLGPDVDVERASGLRQDERDLVAGDTFEYGLQPAQHLGHVHRLEGTRLLLAVHGNLLQETRRARDLAQQQLTTLPQRRVAVDGIQPLMAILTHVAKQVVARHGHFRCESSHGFHPLRLTELFLRSS